MNTVPMPTNGDDTEFAESTECLDFFSDLESLENASKSRIPSLKHSHPRQRRPPSINLFDIKNLGLVVNYGVIGFLETLTPMILAAVLGSESDQFTRLLAVRHLTLLLRVLVAWASDVWPIFHVRRRPYLLMGWVLALGPFIRLSTIPDVTYHTTTTSRGDELTMLIVVPVGLLLVGVSCDGLMVEYSRRESVVERGCIPLLLLAIRSMGALVGQSVVTIGSADEPSPCHDDLGCGLPLALVVRIAALVAVVGFLSAAWGLQVPSTLERQELQVALTTDPSKAHRIGQFLQHPTTWRFAIFVFATAATTAWSTPRPQELATTWLRLDAPWLWIADSIHRAIVLMATLSAVVCLRHGHWRRVALWSGLVGTLLGQLPGGLVALLVETHPTAALSGFFAGHALSVLGHGLISAIQLLVAVEICGISSETIGVEATTFALVGAVHELGRVSGSTLGWILHGIVRDATASETTHDAAVLTAATFGLLLVLRGFVLGATISFVPRNRENLVRATAAGTRSPPVASRWLVPAVGLGIALTLGAVASDAVVLHTGHRRQSLVWFSSFFYLWA